MNRALLCTEFFQLALIQSATALVEIQLNFHRASSIFIGDKFCEFCGGYMSLYLPSHDVFFLIFSTQLVSQRTEIKNTQNYPPAMAVIHSVVRQQ